AAIVLAVAPFLPLRHIGSGAAIIVAPVPVVPRGSTLPAGARTLPNLAAIAVIPVPARFGAWLRRWPHIGRRTILPCALLPVLRGPFRARCRGPVSAHASRASP